MTMQTTAKFRPGHPLFQLKGSLECIDKIDHYELNMAAGAVRSLGDIIYTYHGNGIEGLNNSDMEGVGLAILSLGRYLERIAADLEENVSAVGKQADELAVLIGKEGQS